MRNALIELHGGTVEARSEGLGKGSEFIVSLPLVQVSEQKSPQKLDPVPISQADRKRILVVDDNRDAAMSLSMMLDLMGNETKVAHDGIEALEIAPGFHPDVVLLDIGMPRLNGYETARRIRETSWGREIMLIALTGWGQEEDRRKSKDAGFNSHMTKPADPETLSKIINNVPAQRY